jgi:hypothetical protein
MRARRGAIVATILAVVIAGLAIPAPAFATGTGTLKLELETPAGTPLPLTNVDTDVFHQHGEFDTYFNELQTNGLGQVTYTGVPAGVHLTVNAFSNSAYVGSSKSDLEVTSGHTLTVKLVYAFGATVNGTLISGGPLSGADVALLGASGKLHYYATTNGSGAFSITGVKSGTYRVQFNSRKVHSQTFAALNAGWSYWNGATSQSTRNWISANTLTVVQQTAHAGPSTKTVSGAVGALYTLSGDVEYWSPASSHAGQDVQIVGTYAADSFDTKLNGSGELYTWLNPGKYRVAIDGDFDTITGVLPVYWYKSDAEGPATSESSATWITFAGNKSIDFIKKPVII